MDLSSPYFPVRVKQEPLEDTYDAPGYHSSLYPPNYGVKQEVNEAYSHTIAEADSAGMHLETANVPKKRGRKKKIKTENENGADFADTQSGKTKIKQEKGVNETFKERKKVDRFNGMPEEEVAKRTLPDHLVPNLDIVVIGINPGLFAAYKGHHYAGPGNHFWKCLFLAGLIPEPMTSDDDFRLIEHGIGFTNVVERTTRGSADLSRKEIKDGAKILLEKLQKYRPKIAVFNGKGIYEVFSGRKNFDFGKQPDFIEGTTSVIFVMPSSSARCAQLPRAIDKVPFYEALKKLRDHMNGKLPNLQESEVTFPDVKLKIESDDGLKTEALDIKEELDDGQNTIRDADGNDMQATPSGTVDKPKKKYKKKPPKKKKCEEDEDENLSQQPSPSQTYQQQSPYPNDMYSNQNQASLGGSRIKQEKQDELMYSNGGINYGQQACPYGAYPPPPAHSRPYYGSPAGPGPYGAYPAPQPLHPQFVSSGSLNQLESFVDQIPNIGGQGMLPGGAVPPPPAHGGNYAQAVSFGPQGPMAYPPPPPAHENQGANLSSYSAAAGSPPAGYGYPSPINNASRVHSPTAYQPQAYCGDSYQQQRSPVYTDLDSVQVKQERIDPGYEGY